MADRLGKFLAHVDMVKITCVDSTELVEEARRIHELNPTPTAALGRVLTMAVMMGASLKEDDGKIKAKDLNAPFMETSALNCINVEKAFNFLIEEIANFDIGIEDDFDFEEIKDGKNVNNINLNNNEKNNEKKKKCCSKK